MELVSVLINDNHETCSKFNEMSLDRDEDIHANKDRKLSQTEARARNRGLSVGRKCVMLSTVCFGLTCILLVAAIVVLHIKLKAEREEQATHMLQSGSRDQMEKDQLQNSFNSLSQKNLELETRVNDLTAEKNQLQSNFSSLNQKKLELETRANDLTTKKSQLETRVSDLTSEKSQLQRSVESLSQKKLELETELRKLSGQGNGMLFISTELKSWSDSRQYCRDRGADLVIINTEEKQRLISSLFKEIVWIGLSDTEQEGNMKWVDNSTLNQGVCITRSPVASLLFFSRQQHHFLTITCILFK